jgi:hypothetical protein
VQALRERIVKEGRKNKEKEGKERRKRKKRSQLAKALRAGQFAEN